MGQDDKTCIIWDINKLAYSRCLRHDAAVVAAAINDLTGNSIPCLITSPSLSFVLVCEADSSWAGMPGNILTCTSNGLYLYSINGDLLGSKVLSGASLER